MDTRTLYGINSKYQVSKTALDSGGQATIFAVNGVHSSGNELLYKHFNKPPKTTQEADELSSRLELLVDVGRKVFCQNLSELGDTPASSFSWPIDAVRTSQGIQGIIMPRAPSRFFNQSSQKARTMERLYLYRTQPPPAHIRISVLFRVCRAMEFLETNNLVHGDIAPKNIMWTSTPRPEIFVLDVDGIHKNNAPYFSYVFTNQWEDPRVRDKQIVGHDIRSDWYALALFIYRVLTGTTSPIPPANEPWKANIDQLIPHTIRSKLISVLENRGKAAYRVKPSEWSQLLAQEFFPGLRVDIPTMVAIDTAYARRRRDDRRSGALGPPFTAIAQSLSPFSNAWINGQ